MGIRFVKGRDFTEHDDKDAAKVVIVSEGFVRRFFPNEDPIGKRIKVSFGKPENREIVGIVGDVKYSSLNAEPQPALYLPHAQDPEGYLYVVARSTSEPAAIVSVVQKEVWAVDKDLPVSGVVSMEALLSTSLTAQRFNMLLLAVFAAIALALAAIGIYGVLSYTVSQRIHEIGIRIALGAQPRDIVGLVLRQGMSLALIGIIVGLAGAVALTRLMSSLLYGVSATDPITFALISLLLAIAAMLACWIPARRAMKIDPMIALRYE